MARACIHGVDRNPMAVELTKVALWIETVEPGKPLGFLDANIRCGDSLLGLFDLKALEQGIPDAAYKQLSDDDKETAKHFAKLNKAECEGQGSLDFAAGGGRTPAQAPLADETRALRAMPEDSPEEIAEKRKRFAAARADPRRWNLRVAADLYMAAFLTPKTGGVPTNRNTVTIPTTNQVWDALAGRTVYGPLVARAQDLVDVARAFHWPLEFPDIFSTGGFDVVLGNPPWDTMSPDVKEFFSKYDEEIRFLSPAQQKEHMALLLEVPGVREAWDAHCRDLYVLANFMRESGRYLLFAEGNLGKGDFNVYRMFMELALSLVREGGRAAQFVPENLYNGANATAIRRHLFEKCRLHALIAFENSRKVWFDIHTAAKFCLYVASPGGCTEVFAAAFGINSEEKLAALRTRLPFDIPVSLVSEFSPDALAIAEVAHVDDITVSRKLYTRFPKFGAEIPGLARREYAAEVHMGNDREGFEEDLSGLPVFEGRMVEAFDYRAKAYVSGRGRSAVWKELPFGTAEKQLKPQWRMAEKNIPRKVGDRWKKYRLGFCDVASPSNQRSFVCSLIPPLTICGDKVPTILFSNDDNRLLMLWLAVANAICMDFIVRKKVALKMSLTLVDSLPLPRTFDDRPLERAIAARSLRLAAAGKEMMPFWRETAPMLGLDAEREAPVDCPVERERLMAEIDVLVARDIFQISRDEMRYLLDPSDVLGADCGFETFGALKRAEKKKWNGQFRTRDLVLDIWNRLPNPNAVEKERALVG